jgi:hypothetical protein
MHRSGCGWWVVVLYAFDSCLFVSVFLMTAPRVRHRSEQGTSDGASFDLTSKGQRYLNRRRWGQPPATTTLSTLPLAFFRIYPPRSHSLRQGEAPLIPTTTLWYYYYYYYYYYDYYDYYYSYYYYYYYY